MFCFHKYGEIKEGYQYCIKCNKATPLKCKHDFEIISKLTDCYGIFHIVQRCKKCAEIKDKRID